MISESLSKWGVDGLFVQKDENLRYISGFTGSDSYLFVTPESFYLLTDSRYVEQAKEEAKGFTVVDYRGKLAETLAVAMWQGALKNWKPSWPKWKASWPKYLLLTSPKG